LGALFLKIAKNVCKDGGFFPPLPVIFPYELKGYKLVPENSKSFEVKNCSKFKYKFRMQIFLITI